MPDDTRFNPAVRCCTPGAPDTPGTDDDTATTNLRRRVRGYIAQRRARNKP